MSAAPDTIRIALGAAPATDAFGLAVRLDGAAVLETVQAEGPGLFRALETPFTPAAPVRAGWVIGFLARGPVRLPVLMPCDGWVLAAAPDGARVGHGTPLFRILRAREGIIP